MPDFIAIENAFRAKRNIFRGYRNIPGFLQKKQSLPSYHLKYLNAFSKKETQLIPKLFYITK